MREWEFRRQRRWSFAAAILCILVVLSLAAEFVYARATNAPEPARMLVAQNNQVRISAFAICTDSSVHFYTADVNGTVIRFFVIHQTAMAITRRLWTPARFAVPDRLPPGRPERGLPQLRRHDLYSLHRRNRRMQSHSREVARGSGRSGCGSFSPCRRHASHDSSLKNVHSPGRRILRSQPAPQNSDGGGAGGRHGRCHRDAHGSARSRRPPRAGISQPGRQSARHPAIGFASRSKLAASITAPWTKAPTCPRRTSAS